MGLIQRLENRVVGKPPKKLQGKPQQDDGEFDEVDQGDYPSGTIFGADGRPVFIPDPAWQVGLRRLFGGGWVSKQEWERKQSEKCGHPVKWEDSGGGTQVG